MVSLRRVRGSRRAIAVTEMALVLPLVLLLTMALLEYGWIFLKAQQITNAARHGARVGARADSTLADIESGVLTVMTAAGLQGSGYLLVVEPPGISDLDAGTSFSVTVRVTYANIGLNMPLAPTPDALEAAMTMVREGR